MRRYETYLGDGAYVYIDDSNSVVLYTSDGVQETDRIVLEPEVMGTLLDWLEKLGVIT